jgi:hypothetical protein
VDRAGAHGRAAPAGAWELTSIMPKRLNRTAMVPGA